MAARCGSMAGDFQPYEQENRALESLRSSFKCHTRHGIEKINICCLPSECLGKLTEFKRERLELTIPSGQNVGALNKTRP